MNGSIGRRGLLALCAAVTAVAVAAPTAIATNGGTPDFFATTDRGDLLTIKEVKKKRDGRKDRGQLRATKRQDIRGLPTGVDLVGIDVRPINGELYGIGSNSVVYRVNPRTGIALGVAGPDTAPFTPPLKGQSFGVDFNPTSPGGGAIRIVSDRDQSLRASPNDGTATEDGDINGGMGNPRIVGAAYRNSAISVRQPVETELYVLDAAGDALYEQDPPNDGTLVDPQPVSFNVTDRGGFDLLGNTNRSYVASQKAGGGSKLFRVNVNSGDSRKLGTVRRNDRTLTGLAIIQKSDRR